MGRSIEKDALELLTKENERYRLERLGLFRSVREEAAALASEYPPLEGESFFDWKTRCLREFYREKGFSAFCRDNVRNPQFEAVTASLMRVHLRKMFEASERTDTDRYLAPDADTLSYALEPDLFQELYTINFSGMPSFGNTGELDSFCRNMAKDNFPVNETRIIKDMRDNKNFYWEKFYLKLKPITAAFCYQMSGIAGDNNIHDIWSDTCISVNAR